MTFAHTSVLLDETIESLRVRADGAATAFARVGGGPSIVDLKLESDGETFG